jgi:hypothetical protein
MDAEQRFCVSAFRLNLYAATFEKMNQSNDPDFSSRDLAIEKIGDELQKLNSLFKDISLCLEDQREASAPRDAHANSCADEHVLYERPRYVWQKTSRFRRFKRWIGRKLIK